MEEKDKALHDFSLTDFTNAYKDIIAVNEEVFSFPTTILYWMAIIEKLLLIIALF